MKNLPLIPLACSLALASLVIRCQTITPQDALQAASYQAALSKCIDEAPTRSQADECRKQVDCGYGQGPCYNPPLPTSLDGSLE